MVHPFFLLRVLLAKDKDGEEGSIDWTFVEGVVGGRAEFFVVGIT